MHRYIVLLLILSFTLINSRGQTSDVIESYGLPHPTQAKALYFWFDNNAERKLHAYDLEGRYILDASSLSDGLHIFHCQIIDENDMTASVRSSFFVKITPDKSTEPIIGKKIIYWFDDESTILSVNMEEGEQLLDASSLTEGLHTLHYQVLCNNGQMTPVISAMFLNMHLEGDVAKAQSFKYWFDDDTQSMKQSDIFGSVQEIDVSSLTSGIHAIHFQLIDDNGKPAIPSTKMFFKDLEKQVPDSCNGITKYQYWINEKTADIKTVNVNDTIKAYKLIGLFPLQKEPIHSSLFHFEIVDDIPMLYAKNIFHIRFHDAQGYFVDDSRPFIDYNVSEQLNDITLIETGVRQTIEKPLPNAIRWFKLDAEAGDSLQFKLDRAATIQLFAPSGKEAYNASGAESVKWGGLHARESGTFYLALHDVTAQQGTTISIDYNHIDKYAVLRQDVSVVGNGGCSTITFEGNGFYNLNNVYLVNNGNDSIRAKNIEYISDSEISIIFDFEGAHTNNYDASFDFGEESRLIHNSISIEPVDSINLTLKIEAPTRFIEGNTVTYNISITNSGNSTAYCVPLQLQLLTKNSNVIYFAKFSDNIPKCNIELPDDTLINQDSLSIFNEWIKEQGDLLHFINLYDSINAQHIKDCYLTVNIGPKSSYNITLTLKSTETIELQALIPSKWMFCTFSNDSVDNFQMKMRRQGGVKESLCCYREKIECVMNIIVGAFDFASIFPQAKLSACIASISNTSLQFYYDVWCGEEMGGKNPKNAAKDLIWDAVNSFIGCLIPGGNKLKGLQITQWLYQHIYDNIKTTYDCAMALTQKIPNCPPDNDREGGSSTPVKSMDPNEIYGYLAESGSNAVHAEKKDVYYTIQFENGTTFATAPAHDVWVTDTLNTQLFDLSTFEPTRFKIGEKTVELSGDKNFVTTVDMRPEIYAIAQVEGTFDETTGIARWHISSLDPMTMEPTDDVMQGVLPVNTNGQGIGEVSYDISLKAGLKHRTLVENRAGIVFDYNDVIMTPTWTNVIDRIAPESRVTTVNMLNDSTATVSIETSDELSGPWRYDVYVQYGEGSAWWKAAENIPVDSIAEVNIYEGIDHGFYVVATDSAGNVEQKEAVREYTLNLGTTTAVEVPDAEKADETVYDLQGRKQDATSRKRGIYVVTDEERSRSQKVVKK